MFLAACMTAEGKKGSVRLESSYDITLVRGDDGAIYMSPKSKPTSSMTPLCRPDFCRFRAP